MGATSVIVEGEFAREGIRAEIAQIWSEQGEMGWEESKLTSMISTMQQQGWNLVAPSGSPYGDGALSEGTVRAVLIGKLSRRG